ncbi:hypothetical protein [Granulicella sp. dw_53]|uniref:hypothetical protein n=1 Tax=Granulicella sp. dw_53 TaxID=2719792 RepID=UPI001BD59BB2|nr:hypothetical protein [Granulicella sp. dw_53]
MHKYLIYGTYGWLVFTGTMHFVIDVLAQYLRKKRTPGPEATLYYGLNTAFALSQILFGFLGLLVAWQSIALVSHGPTVVLSLVAAVCWFLFVSVFIEYWEPKLNIGIYAVLAIAAAVTA